MSMYLSMICSLIGFLFTANFWTASPMTVNSPVGSTQTDPSITQGANAYLNAVLDGDLPAITAMFEEDAILMPPDQPFYQGREALGRFYGGFCHGPAKPTAFSF